MKLFQLLYLLSPNIPLIVFNLNGQEICRVISKELLSTDLFEYDVFNISGIGNIEFYKDKIPTLILTLVK